MRLTCLKLSLMTGLILLASLTQAQTPPSQAWLENIGKPEQWTIAVLSPLNHVQKQAAYTKTVECLERSLINQGLSFLTIAELRPTLRRHRIRSTGQISVDDARIIQEYAEIDVILIPSIDFYVDSKDNPEYGLSLRLVRPDQMRVIGAVSSSATGMDYVRLFGVGKIESSDSLIANVVEKAVASLLGQFKRLTTEEIVLSKPRKMAVLQFDNLSKMKRAGSIVANWTISELVERGYLVIEPGAVAEIVTLLGDLPVGGIDYQKLEAITRKYELDYLITGQLNQFKLARGSSRNAVPSIELDARLLEAETGRITRTFHTEATGADGHIAFGMGRVRSGGALLRKQLSEMLSEFRNLEPRLTGMFDSN